MRAASPLADGLARFVAWYQNCDDSRHRRRGIHRRQFVLDWLGTGEPLVNLDKLTYAGNLGSLASLLGDERIFRPRRYRRAHRLRRSRDTGRAPRQFRGQTRRSVDPRAAAFIDTNARRSACAARAYWSGAGEERSAFRFHVSTDEVYGRSVPTIIRSRKRRHTHRTPVLGVEGRGGSSGARLSPYGRRRSRLFEQLRAAPVPGETRLDDRQRNRRQVVATATPQRSTGSMSAVLRSNQAVLASGLQGRRPSAAAPRWPISTWWPRAAES
jgi:hypothetical protein